MPLLIIQLALLIAVIYIVGLLISRNRKRKNSDESVINAAAALSSPAENSKTSEILENDADAVAPVAKQGSVVAPVEVVAANTTIEAPAETLDDGKKPAAKASVVKTQEAKALPAKAPPAKTPEVKAPEAKAPRKAGSKAAVSTDDSVKQDAVAAVKPTGRPQGRDTARRGKPDDLTRIKGVGKALQEKMFGLGVFHFDQIAEWTPEQAAWVGAHMSFPGRIEREEWIAQAVSLGKSATKPVVAKPAAAKSAAKPKAKTAVTPVTAKRAKPAQPKKP